jgi:valyl-tRNA synthetase
VHPDDERYRAVVGSEVEVPLTGRRVRVLADPFVDPAFGTGAVKITPAHDPADFEAGRRLGLAELQVIDDTGHMSPAAGTYAGLDRFEARQRIVHDLEQRGLLLEVRPHEHAVGHSQRSGVMIEPLVSTQWFVKVAPLAQPAVRAVEEGRVRFVPASWAKTYFEWMRNIHDWCISRQLWWGHRIPAWYCDPCGREIVAEEEPQRCTVCGGKLRQDPDVLDTWFSSALWPFSTLGWPERTRDLARYYPTDLLITGHDIIFFWVARMIMLGLKFMDDVPFRDVYIHGLVRDAEGQKMSKSRGNTVVPGEVQQRYGTDAVRFTMAILAAPGNDIPLAHERMGGYRAFANKLWNATRFVLLKVPSTPPAPSHRPHLSLPDRWILSRAEHTREQVDQALTDYRFDRAADVLYHFVWHQFCDWYIELVKPELDAAPGTGPTAASAAVLIDVLGDVLRMLHPFMPFITAELWSKLPGAEGDLALARWPEARPARRDEEAERQLEQLQEIVVAIRHLRNESRIDPARRIEVLLRSDDDVSRGLIEQEAQRIAVLVRAQRVFRSDAFPEGGAAVQGVASGVQFAIPLAGLLDLDAERARLRQELARLDRELANRSKRLSNPSFLERAPEDVVSKERRAHQELLEQRGRLDEHLTLLGRGRESS